MTVTLLTWRRGRGTTEISKSAPPPANVVPVIEPQAQAFAAYAGSESCRECHPASFDAWKDSHHALAERPTTQPLDAAPVDRHPELASPVRIIGHNPLQQFLVPKPGGRLQTADTAYDPRRREWFNVFGDEQRDPGEWGHWTGRGMNWNSMCASCHNTRVRKNYDPASDTYDTKMVEMGIGCESCHGPMKDHVIWQTSHAAATRQSGEKRPRSVKDPTLKPMSRDAMFDACAACHSRRGELSGDFKPGDSYHDHYRLSVVDETDLYYPDGQVREEDFEVAAFLGSRMYAAGVRCVDCHNAHTGKPVVTGDFMCMRCHQGIDTYPTAPVIKPPEHVFHKPESDGARCVNCHMPQTTYMQRHVRRDHGLTIPDPLLTKQHGVPNACNRCHTDKDVDWSIAAVEKWYGPRMERHTRRRTQWIASARQGQTGAQRPLMEMLADPKEFAYWKAVAAGLLERWVSSDPRVEAALRGQVAHPDPLVRAAATRSLALLAESRPDARALLREQLEDPRRNVRLAAAWGLRSELDPASPAGRELLHMLEVNFDQPVGRLQWAHYRLARGDSGAAVKELSTAVQWDPSSPSMRHAMAVLYSLTGNPAQAVEELRHAIRLAPASGEYHYLLGLALHESGDLPGATAALREAVRLDPTHAVAWYNLGLAQHAGGQSDAALLSLHRGETANPLDPRIPYAQATILMQLNRPGEAVDAARRSLDARPDFEPARQFLGQFGTPAPRR